MSNKINEYRNLNGEPNVVKQKDNQCLLFVAGILGCVVVVLSVSLVLVLFVNGGSELVIHHEAVVQLWLEPDSEPMVATWDDERAIGDINAILNKAGSSVQMRPLTARPHLDLAQAQRFLTEEEKQVVLDEFTLDRDLLLLHTRMADRSPSIPGGGSLSTEVTNGDRYPVLHDIMDPDPDDQKFEPLHLNQVRVNGTSATKEQDGTDEVMTVTYGEFVWYHALEWEENGVDAQVIKVSVQAGDDGKAWAHSYNGMNPHGASTFIPTKLIGQIFGNTPWTVWYQEDRPDIPDNPFIV